MRSITPVIAPAVRRTSLVAASVFVTLLVVPALFQILYGFRGTELSRWRQWLVEEPHTADALRRIESDFDARFFLGTTVRTWIASRIGPAPLGASRWAEPTGEYFVVESDVMVPRASGFMNPRFDRPTQARTALADLSEQLRARGIHLIVVPIPSKSSIYPDKVVRTYDLARGPDLNLDHAAWFSALREAHVDLIDLADALWHERAREHTDATAATFTRADSHWTWHGMAIAVDAIRQHAEPYLIDAPRVTGLQQKIVRRIRPNDLAFKAAEALPVETEERIALLDAHDKTVLADDPEASVVVLGDSFAAGFVDEGSGLAQAVEAATGVSTRSLAVYGGDVGSMRHVLTRPAALGPHVRVVIFAFAQRHLITSDWPAMSIPR